MAKQLYPTGRPVKDDARHPIQFTSYKADGSIYARRFELIVAREILGKLKTMMQPPEVVKAEAFDTDLQRLIKVRPTTRGGYRPGSGRRGTNRKRVTTIMISDEATDILRQQKNKSAYIDQAIREKYARDNNLNHTQLNS